jgi:hypothetical protein
MWKSILRCGIVGGIIVFLWTIISWNVLPLRESTMHKFVNEAEVVKTLTRYAPKDGLYVIPSVKTRQADAKDQTFVVMNIKRRVDSGQMAGPIFCCVIREIVAAMLITYLLLKGKSINYWNRVWFITAGGVLAVLLGIIPLWNWWYFPIYWLVIDTFDIVAGWFLAAVVMAKLLKN